MRMCRNFNPRGKAVGFQSFRMRVFYVMGNLRLYEIEGIHMLGTSESERLRVTTLPSPKRLRAGRSKSFPRDRLSPPQRGGFFML
jgi:hypothetical protein